MTVELEPVGQRLATGLARVAVALQAAGGSGDDLERTLAQQQIMLLLGGLVVPAALLPVERGWMAFAHALSKVTTPIFMGLVYFLVFTPFGVVRRMMGKSGLVHVPANASYWATLDRDARKRRSMLRQF